MRFDSFGLSLCAPTMCAWRRRSNFPRRWQTHGDLERAAAGIEAYGSARQGRRASDLRAVLGLVHAVLDVLTTYARGSASPLFAHLPDEADPYLTIEGPRLLRRAYPRRFVTGPSGDRQVEYDAGAPAEWEHARDGRLPRQRWGLFIDAITADVAASQSDRSSTIWIEPGRHGKPSRLRIVRFDLRTVHRLRSRSLLLMDATLHPAIATVLDVRHHRSGYLQGRKVVQALTALHRVGDLRVRRDEGWILSTSGQQVVGWVASWVAGRIAYVICRKSLKTLLEAEAAVARARTNDVERFLRPEPEYEAVPYTPPTGAEVSLPGTVRSVAEMLDVLHICMRRIVGLRERYFFLFPEHARIDLWFRGQPDASDGLTPTALRSAAFHSRGQEHAATPHEVTANREFRRHAFAYLEAERDETHTYFLARHHGLPSRLLDWSTSPLVALFFACVGSKDTPGSLFAIDASWPLSVSCGGQWPPPEDEYSVFAEAEKGPLPWRSSRVTETVRTLYGEDANSDPLVLAMEPPTLDRRISAQQAMFTLHAPGSSDLKPPYLHRLEIPRDAKIRILRELSFLGTGWESLFPGLDHLARDLSQRWDFVHDHGEGGTWMLHRGSREWLTAPLDPSQPGEDLTDLGSRLGRPDGPS